MHTIAKYYSTRLFALNDNVAFLCKKTYLLTFLYLFTDKMQKIYY